MTYYQITHNTRALGQMIQSYATNDATVALDLNSAVFSGSYQEWSIEDARKIARLLELAATDAEEVS